MEISTGTMVHGITFGRTGLFDFRILVSTMLNELNKPKLNCDSGKKYVASD